MDQNSGDGQTKTEWIDSGVDGLSIDCTRTGTETEGSMHDTDPPLDSSTVDFCNDRSTDCLHELCTDVSVEPAYADGRLYTVSDGSIVAIEEATGERAWERSTDETPASSPAVSDERVFWQTDRALHAVSSADGAVCWSVPTTGSAQGQPVVDDGIVVTASRGGTVSIVTAEFGRSVRSFRPPHVPSSLAVEDGALFVSSLEGGMTAYDATDGTERWRFAPDRAIHAPPMVGPDAVYVATVDDGGVWALDRDVGTPCWSHQVGSSVWTPPVLAADTVYVGSSSGTLSAVRAVDGAERWRTTVPAGISSGPVVVEETVYVGCEDGLYVLERETGTIRRRFELCGPVTVGASSTSVFARDQRGSLFAVSP